jgi:hypothetical protein
MKNLLKIIIVALVLLLPGCKQGSSTWIAGWKEAAPLIERRAGASVVVANGYIYMIGGVNDSGFLKTTEYAKIRNDGSLGEWKMGPMLNAERGHAEAVFYNGFIYVVGGGNGPNGSILLRSAERTRLKSDGSMEPWTKEKASLVIPRRCSMLVVSGSHIYAVGGFGGVMLDTVERVEVLEDGHLGEWVLEPEIMTIPRYVNGVQEAAGAIYVIGGHAQKRGGGIDYVELAKIKEEGGLGPWKRTSPLGEARFGLLSVVYKDYLYALGGIGGVSGLDFTATGEKALIGPDGELAAWQPTTPFSQPRATYSMVVVKNRVYILGGAWGPSSGTYLKSVEYATFNDTGDIGFRGGPADEAAYKEKLASYAKRAAKRRLPNKGLATEVLQTKTYTYIHVSMEGGVVWLAAPKMEIDPNTHILFSYGAVMSNFHSRDLDRTFADIILVDQVKKMDGSP